MIPEFVGRIPVVSSAAASWAKTTSCASSPSRKTRSSSSTSACSSFDNAELVVRRLPPSMRSPRRRSSTEHGRPRPALDLRERAARHHVRTAERRHYPKGHRHAGVRYRRRSAPGHPSWQAPCRGRGVKLVCSAGANCSATGPDGMQPWVPFLDGKPSSLRGKEAREKTPPCRGAFRRRASSKMEYPL